MRNGLVVWIALAAGVGVPAAGAAAAEEAAPRRLYWLIPDGLRADPDLFTIFRWAEEGKLPNLRKMMQQGAWGYSIPDFPSHTPTNFASLLTGTHPARHGIADGPMHTEGAPLVRPSVGGFSSGAKRVPPIWTLLEEAGRKVVLLSIPGSTPPEIERGIVIRGRWGVWGADTPAVIFEPLENLPMRREAGKAFKLFFLGQRLTEFVETRAASGWQAAPRSFSPAREATLEAYGLQLFIRVADSSDDGITNYDTVRFSRDRETAVWELAQGATSAWEPVELDWQGQPFESEVRATVIKLWRETGAFRLRLFFNNANAFNTQPGAVAREMTRAIGPMVDFVDNWPAQLVYEPEDQRTFFEEATDTLEWHRKAAGFILDTYRPDAFIQDTYTPNQMLEARWWTRHVDPQQRDYDSRRAQSAWEDILALYQGIDAILGAAMEHAGDDAIIAFSSDHGIIPLHKQVRLNNLFARKGWLRFQIDEQTGEPAIDWANTTVVYLKMAYVYVHPGGLAGDWRRASGPKYEALRQEVIQAITELADEDGATPLVRAVPWEKAEEAFRLPTDRVGDLVLEVRPGYTWWEEVSADLALFSDPLTSGYKQGIDPGSTKGVWTPFLVMGPGVKKGVALAQPISHVDQMPTLLRLVGVDVPEHVEGRVLEEILE